MNTNEKGTDQEQAKRDAQREIEHKALRLPTNGYDGREGHTLATAIAGTIAPLASTNPNQASQLAEEALSALGKDLRLFWYAVASVCRRRGHRVHAPRR
jgi:hypothetical protein